MKTVASFTEPYLAHLARGKLTSEGITAVVTDEYLIQTNWTLSNAIGGVKVLVPDEELERALTVLAPDQYACDTMSGGTDTSVSEDVCPVCGSRDITANRYSLWSLIPSILLRLPVFFRRNKWACRTCKAKWK